MPKNTETQQMHMYSYYTGSLYNIAFPMVRFTSILTSLVFVNIWMQYQWSSALYRGREKHLWIFFSLNSTLPPFSLITNLRGHFLHIIIQLVCYMLRRREEDLNVCLFRLTRNFSLIWRRHHHWWRAAHFDLCSALMLIVQWGFLACHTYCDTGHPLIMIISDDP